METTVQDLTNTVIGLIIYGYIRMDSDDNFKYLIKEIIHLIICFYKSAHSLYVVGDGKYGRLGLEEYNNGMCKKPTVCPPFTTYQNHAIDVAASTQHALILDFFGEVWMCGRRNYVAANFSVPKKMVTDEKVVGISVGTCHSLLLLSDGDVQSFGYNGRYGQLGHGKSNKLETLHHPETIESLTRWKIIQISAGDYYSAALTEDGDLFCFGLNFDGQCGLGKKKGHIRTPTKVRLDEKIAFVECGSYHTLIITRSRRMYSFGYGGNGELGHGNNDSKISPTLIAALENKLIKTCAAGDDHSLCIDEDSIIWSFGSNEEGQCGLTSDIIQQSTPKKIDWFIKNNIKAKDCAAGDYASSVTSEDGQIYAFGSNENYGIALDEENYVSEDKHYYIPQKLLLPRDIAVKKVSMAHDYCAFICY